MAKKGDTSADKPKKLTRAELDQKLIDNFIGLQRVLTNLSIKFESLSDQMSKLLQLFEISAKSFAEKQAEGGNIETDKDFLKKIDTLLDQNKTIAKGLTLMEGKLREKVYGNELPREAPRPQYTQPQNTPQDMPQNSLDRPKFQRF